MSEEVTSSETPIDGLTKIHGQSNLGLGVDVFNRELDIASPETLRKPVLDFSKDQELEKVVMVKSETFGEPISFHQEYSIQKVFDYVEVSGSDIKTFASENIEELSKELSVEVGIEGAYGGFSGSAKTRYEKTYNKTSKETFTGCTEIINCYRLRVRENQSSFKNRLAPVFEEALKKIDDIQSCHNLFREFGTHILKDAIFGGQTYFQSIVKSSEVESIENIEAEVKAAYGVFKGSTSSQTKHTEKFTSGTSKTSCHTSTGKIPSDFSNSEELGSWWESVWNMPILSKFDENSLVPIWDLFEEGDEYYNQAQLLKDYYDSEYRPFHGGLEVINTEKSVNFECKAKNGRWLSGLRGEGNVFVKTDTSFSNFTLKKQDKSDKYLRYGDEVIIRCTNNMERALSGERGDDHEVKTEAYEDSESKPAYIWTVKPRQELTEKTGYIPGSYVHANDYIVLENHTESNPCLSGCRGEDNLYTKTEAYATNRETQSWRIIIAD